MDESDKTPLEDLPDYAALADDRNEAVLTWAAEHVDDARTELIEGDSVDIDRAKQDLRAALQILESEID